MSAADSLFIPRKIWTRAEADRLSAVGLSLELVNGELIDHMGKKPPHVYWKNVLFDWLAEQFGSGYARAEDPIDVAPQDNPTSEPEPDLIVTVQSIRVTRGSNPEPDDLRLVVEVSDSTFDYDRTVKASLYARAGIREYWIVDVRIAEAPRLLIHLEPRDGSYRKFSAHTHEVQIPVFDGRRLCLQSLL